MPAAPVSSLSGARGAAFKNLPPAFRPGAVPRIGQSCNLSHTGEKPQTSLVNSWVIVIVLRHRPSAPLSAYLASACFLSFHGGAAASYLAMTLLLILVGRLSFSTAVGSAWPAHTPAPVPAGSRLVAVPLCATPSAETRSLHAPHPPHTHAHTPPLHPHACTCPCVYWTNSKTGVR